MDLGRREGHDRDYFDRDRIRDFVERDARGRFVNAMVDRPAVPMLVTHVGRSLPGFAMDRVTLSLAPAEDAA